MRSVLKIFVVFSVCIACSNKDRVPSNVLSGEKMKAIIWDLVRADEFVDNYVLKDSTLKRDIESEKLYEQVFQIHQTSKEQFQKSISFYQSNPVLLTRIMDSLKAYGTRVNEDIFKPVPIEDSTGRPALKRPHPSN